MRDQDKQGKNIPFDPHKRMRLQDGTSIQASLLNLGKERLDVTVLYIDSKYGITHYTLSELDR